MGLVYALTYGAQRILIQTKTKQIGGKKMLARINKSYVPAYWDDFFNDNFFNHLNSRSSNESRPAVNVSENDKEYFIEVAAPGIDRKSFHLEIENDLLTISSEKKRTRKIRRRIFFAGSFITTPSKGASSFRRPLIRSRSMPLLMQVF